MSNLPMTQNKSGVTEPRHGTDVSERRHDPLCPTCPYECPCHPVCQCDLIGNVRADERERAAQRILSLDHIRSGLVCADDAAEMARRNW